ncbi:HotDog domain-containing protein [Cokeromyces recurvatus]|uniref:HotDog domain-containing protein n=1 Tax=Cokeromyces recurvatus TaxID=90255 RepID=UPI00221E717C|nr:HotDog domain-containing protein [Cokeromyces recurvatus]KAI7899490.1 HotDog domain-containing protein [Cokeromyces recurvatus]
MIPSIATRSPKFVQKVLDSFMSVGGYDSLVLSGLKILHSENGKLSAEFQVENKHLNRLGTVHGGLLATAVDVAGSLAIATKGLYATGISTDINISYIQSAKRGETITIEARVDKLGKTLAFTTVEMYCEGRLVALGRHNKFVAKAYQHPENIL